MHTIYGNIESGQTPDVVTYFHNSDKSGTIGLWNAKGRLYSVSKFKSNSNDFRLDEYSDANHIMLVGNSTGQLIETQDFDENKTEEYFSYQHGNDGSIVKSELANTSQIILFKQEQTPNLSNGTKCPKHLLQAIGLSQSTTSNHVELYNCGGEYHIANVIRGKITHYTTFSNDLDAKQIQYQVLGFYQAYQIDPNQILKTFGVESMILSQLENYLPSVDLLKVPNDKLMVPAADHTHIYPHYLAHLCVL